MSVKYSHLVWTQALDIDGDALLVLLALADYANDEGRSWYSQPKIARKCRLTERGLRAILHRIAALGYLHIDPGGGRGRTALYTVQIPPIPAPTANPAPPSPFPTETRNLTILKPEPSPLQTRNPPAPESGTTQAQSPHDPSLDPSLRSVTDPSPPARILPLPIKVDYDPSAFIPCEGRCNTMIDPSTSPDHLCPDCHNARRGKLTPMYPRRVR